MMIGAVGGDERHVGRGQELQRRLVEPRRVADLECMTQRLRAAPVPKALDEQQRTRRRLSRIR
jgi:hypothetical protein